MTAPCCASPAVRRARRAALLLLLAAAVLLPLLAHAHDPHAPPEVVAEALFLCDHLPPGGRDLNLSVAAHRGAPGPGAAAVAFEPRAQIAMALSDRVGFTADLGVATAGEAIHAPGASLKLLLQPPVPGRTGIAASLDVFGSTRALGETEAGLGVGAIRSFGRLAFRAGASVATAVGAWTPHLHAGGSAAAALGGRWRLLGEVVADVARGGAALSAGPSVKVALGDGTSLMAGVLVPVAAPAAPTVVAQLTRAL